MKKLFFILLLLSGAVSVNSVRANEARLLRFPAVGGETIVFSYAGDLYSVSVNGGEAKKLTYGDSYDVFPKLSPDGKTIAFTGQFDGNTEVYTLPVEGGVPRRITYSSTLDRDNIGDRMGPNNIVMGWTPDGKQIIYRSRWYAFCSMRGTLYQVDAKGGHPTQLPLTEGGFCSYSPDGKQFAFNRMFREFRTWKHYKGGQADEIWLNRVGTTECKKITTNDNQDIFPMWVGEDIYYISDRDFTMNLFKYNTKSQKTEKVTDFKEYDIKFPAASSKYIVFENGGYIYKYTVATGQCEKVNVTLNDNLLASRNEVRKGNVGRTNSYAISPDAKRVLVTQRGEIFSLPAEKGAVYNLSRTPGANEREAEWSNDGKYIAYFSDKSGEYQLYLLPSDKMLEPDAAECVTAFENGYPSNLMWSKDSKKLYFTTEKRELYSYDIALKALRCEMVGKYQGIYNYDISNDGKWIAYNTSGENKVSIIYLLNLENGESTPVTTAWYDSHSPRFSEDGAYLFYISNRQLRSTYSSVEWNASYSTSANLFVVPLQKEGVLPTAFKADEYQPEEAANEEKKEDKKDKKEDKKEEKADSKTMKVDLDGIIERSALLLNNSGNFQLFGMYNGKLYYSDNGNRKSLDLKNMEIKDAFKGSLFGYATRAKKFLLYDNGLKIADLNNLSRTTEVPMSDISMQIEHDAEWKQIFEETWRIYRDHFYVANMNGVDWKAMHDRYAVLLPYVKHRHDLTYVISEMIGELSVGHTYITSGEVNSAKRLKVGLLGAQFSKDKNGNYKIEKIYNNLDWNSHAVSPLKAAGVDVKVGDYIVAVDGVPVTEYSDIYEALVGRVDATVALDVNNKSSLSGARRVYVKPIADETYLAYYDWVKRNIDLVDKLSGGKVGYIHIPDMSTEGLDMFTKMFYPQLDKKALIIDDRMNGGGNVSPMILERLQREAYRMTMGRNVGMNETVPNEMHYGPKVCLVDKYSMSDGDLFPYGFRKLGLGKLIGTRTWGGIVGISGSKTFIDGQDLRTPFFTSYTNEGEWMVENYGVNPDIEVDINPFDDYLNKDAQLEKAVEVLLDELKNYPELPATPADPIRVVTPN